MTGKRAACIASACVAASAAVLGPATPAAAVSCIYSGYASYSADYARTTDVSGGCATVKARHLYDPIWSSVNYWTNWYYGGDVAQTPATAELIDHQHGGS
jgi:hypothetical protein